MERTEGVEPSPPTLEGGALPMSYIRTDALARGRLYGNQKLLLGLIAQRSRACAALLSSRPPAFDRIAVRRDVFDLEGDDIAASFHNASIGSALSEGSLAA